MSDTAIPLPAVATRTKLNRSQITGFWAAWTGWTLDGMDSVIYALVLSPALTELLPKSGFKATPGNVGFAGSVLFALFLVGWGLSMFWGPIADRCGRTLCLCNLHRHRSFVAERVAAHRSPHRASDRLLRRILPGIGA